MNKCPSCAYERKEFDVRCPKCGHFYPTIQELIAEEVAYEEQHSFRGWCLRIVKADNIRQALQLELRQFREELTYKGWFTLFLVIAFVFALTLSVI
ncbi:MAG: hypothetical protein D0528_05595 [Methylococcales bacterium]|jgi:uncharacterized membrane protein YvbJ|nr:MAG: hypothetical protein D0528_05595 [Methylococcales bacterium]